jgi:putative membrane protein
MSIRFAGGFALLSACALWAGCSKGENAADSTRIADSTAGAVVPTPTPAPATPQLTDQNIAAMLDAANAADSSAGKLASTKGTNSQVKEFGRMMMRDHHTLRQQGKDLAKKLSLTPEMPASDTSATAAKRMLDSLTAMPKGAAWDKAYIDSEVMGHQSVLQTLQTAQSSAQNPDLKNLITQATPTVQQHLTKAQDIQSKLASAPAPDSTKKGMAKPDSAMKKP